jgi:hypothetical protein
MFHAFSVCDSRPHQALTAGRLGGFTFCYSRTAAGPHLRLAVRRGAAGGQYCRLARRAPGSWHERHVQQPHRGRTHAPLHLCCQVVRPQEVFRGSIDLPAATAVVKDTQSTRFGRSSRVHNRCCAAARKDSICRQPIATETKGNCCPSRSLPMMTLRLCNYSSKMARSLVVRPPIFSQSCYASM